MRKCSVVQRHPFQKQAPGSPPLRFPLRCLITAPRSMPPGQALVSFHSAESRNNRVWLAPACYLANSPKKTVFDHLVAYLIHLAPTARGLLRYRACFCNSSAIISSNRIPPTMPPLTSLLVIESKTSASRPFQALNLSLYASHFAAFTLCSISAASPLAICTRLLRR